MTPRFRLSSHAGSTASGTHRQPADATSQKPRGGVAGRPLRAIADFMSQALSSMVWSSTALPWRSSRRKIVDTCIFCNEIDLLRIRLEELWDHVDHFVVVEADETHSGRPKPLFFPEYRSQFEAYEEKLTYHAITNLPPLSSQTEEARTVRENAQRNAITPAVAGLDLAPNDIVIVSDVDEIPRASEIGRLEKGLPRHEYIIFLQINFRGYINNASASALNGAVWTGPVACRVGTLLRNGAQQVRRGNGKSGSVLERRSPEYHYIDNGGWHFSSLGGPEAFWLKAANFMHIDDPYRVIRLGESIPDQQVFSAALNREQCRALQEQYLAHCADPVFSPLEFDSFDIDQDVPAFLNREKDRFRRYFFFTDLS